MTLQTCVWMALTAENGKYSCRVTVQQVSAFPALILRKHGLSNRAAEKK